ncbi:MAG: hypothetical protein ACR2LI_01175 [Propionibacteriaceae bacterium]
MKGRPAGQVGSITTVPAAIAGPWDLSRLPVGLTPGRVQELLDALFELGPFGFQGPARAGLPSWLTSLDHGRMTAQVIAPGYACPSNAFFRAALTRSGEEMLFITSANQSRHLTGTDDAPAHWRATDLIADFGTHPDFVLLAHDDEVAARSRYPTQLPMSTSVPALHATTTTVSGDRRPHLTLTRHGSLSAAVISTVLASLGLGLVLAPNARTRLRPRGYDGALRS